MDFESYSYRNTGRISSRISRDSDAVLGHTASDMGRRISQRQITQL